VLIGPQASGKSVVAKLVYFCRWFPSYFFSQNEKYGSEKYGSTQVDKIAKDELTKMFHPNVFNQNFEIKYQNLNLDYAIRNFPNTNSLELSSNQQVDITSYSNSDDELKISVDLLNLLRNKFGYRNSSTLHSMKYDIIWSVSKTNFIPASRTLLTQVRQIRLKVFDDGIQSSIDPFLSRFVASYNQIRDIYINNDKSLTSDNGDIVNDLIKVILKADVEFINNEDYLVYEDGRRNALTQASSGEQALAPVLLQLKYLYEATRNESTNESIYFEEPELHIFPEFQNLLLKLLITVFKHRDNVGNLLITTHSPYILTYLNNLLQAGEMEKHLNKNKEKMKALDEMVRKEYRIDPDYFNAFQIKNGKAKNIVDEETGLIAENIIDGVSETDYKLFDELTDLILETK